jgi:hypothetical protein
VLPPITNYPPKMTVSPAAIEFKRGRAATPTSAPLQDFTTIENAASVVHTVESYSAVPVNTGKPLASSPLGIFKYCTAASHSWYWHEPSVMSVLSSARVAQRQVMTPISKNFSERYLEVARAGIYQIDKSHSPSTNYQCSAEIAHI